MRVLLTHNRYRLPGGEERHVDLLARWLPEAGVDVSRLEVSSESIPESRAARLAAGVQLAYRPAGGRALTAALESSGADVVHFHNITPLLTPAAFRAASRSGAGVVLTLHNFRFACPAGTLMRNGVPHDDCLEGSSLLCGLRNSRGARLESLAYGIALEVQRRLRLLTRWVDAFVSPSAYLAERAVRAGIPASRLHVVPYGVELPEVKGGGGADAVYVGRLSGEKGVSILLQAARRVDARVVVAGDGPLRNDVEAAANGRICYRGHLTGSELEQLRERAACAVVPSIWPDNLPFAALEALAAGVPVVASRVGGLPEIVDDGSTGFLVPPGDADALAAAINRIAGDPALADRMGAAARAAAAARFDAHAQAAKVADVYRSVT